jgi:hypothetical protein
MRDFIFADLGESIPANNVTFRTDALNRDSEFFTVLQVTGLNNVVWSDQKKAALLAFGKRETSRQELIAVASLLSLNLISQNANGSDAVTIVTATNDSDTESW